MVGLWSGSRREQATVTARMEVSIMKMVNPDSRE